MSSEEIFNILDRVSEYNNQTPDKTTTDIYISRNFHMFLQSPERQKWNKEIILQFLEKALMSGYHGMHFISSKYTPSIDLILEYFFGPDHYIAHRHCDIHNQIILHPCYDKLQIKPMSKLRVSFDNFADFCFE